MVQAVSLNCKEDARRVKSPAGQQRVDGRVRAQLDYGSATHGWGDTDQVAKAHGELNILCAIGG